MNRAAATAALLLTALGAPVSADPLAPPPKPMSLQVSGSGSKQDMDGGGTSYNFKSTVTLELRPDGRLRIEDRGQDVSRLLEIDHSREDIVSWKSVWLGSWTMTAQTLVLDLERAESQCETVITRTGQEPIKSPCPAAANSARLECAATQLRVGPVHRTDADRKSLQDAWRCRLKDGSAKIGGTPLDWAFGKSACIATSPSRFDREYRLCLPAEPEPPARSGKRRGRR